MLRPGELVVNLHHGVRGQRKSYAGVGVSLAQDGGIDPDYLSRHIHQRSARVAWVDGRIGLNESLELTPRHDVTPLRRDDSRRHRFGQTEGTAHRQHPVAHLHAFRITHFGRGQWPVRIHLDHRQIGFLIGADHLGFVLYAWRIVLKTHPNAVSFLDHVPVGDDVALRIHDDT